MPRLCSAALIGVLAACVPGAHVETAPSALREGRGACAKGGSIGVPNYALNACLRTVPGGTVGADVHQVRVTLNTTSESLAQTNRWRLVVRQGDEVRLDRVLPEQPARETHCDLTCHYESRAIVLVDGPWTPGAYALEMIRTDDADMRSEMSITVESATAQ